MSEQCQNFESVHAACKGSALVDPAAAADTDPEDGENSPTLFRRSDSDAERSNPRAQQGYRRIRADENVTLVRWLPCHSEEIPIKELNEQHNLALGAHRHAWREPQFTSQPCVHKFGPRGCFRGVFDGLVDVGPARQRDDKRAVQDWNRQIRLVLEEYFGVRPKDIIEDVMRMKVPLLLSFGSLCVFFYACSSLFCFFISRRITMQKTLLTLTLTLIGLRCRKPCNLQRQLVGAPLGLLRARVVRDWCHPLPGGEARSCCVDRGGDLLCRHSTQGGPLISDYYHIWTYVL